MDDWLVSVVKDGKVVDLYFSMDLHDLTAIRAIHKDCTIEKMRLANVGKSMNGVDDTKFDGWQIRPVRCIETGEVFPSAAECAAAAGVGRTNIYKAIQRGNAVRGRHYEYEK